METGTVIKNGELANCPHCEDFIKRMHSLQADRLELSNKITQLRAQFKECRQATARDCANVAGNAHECEIVGNEGGSNTFVDGCRAVAKTIRKKYNIKEGT